MTKKKQWYELKNRNLIHDQKIRVYNSTKPAKPFNLEAAENEIKRFNLLTKQEQENEVYNEWSGALVATDKEIEFK